MALWENSLRPHGEGRFLGILRLRLVILAGSDFSQALRSELVTFW